jgi:TolA-binding protein
MSAPKDDRDSENLLVRARKSELSEGERRDLERALETSATLKVAYQVGKDFDRVSTVHVGDDGLIARAAGRALEQRFPGRERAGKKARWGQPLRLATAVGVAAVLVVSSTAAWTGLVRPFLRAHNVDLEDSSKPQDEGTVTGRLRAKRPNRAHASKIAAPPESVDALAANDAPMAVLADTPEPLAADSSAKPEAHAPSPVALRPAMAPTSTAADVFRQAHLARHAGNLESARALYAELQARFPGSDEARLSLVSMGKLLLAAGRAEEAERQLSRYLSLGDGELTEEALVGRAQSLERLGRSESERQVWERLLRQYPSSVYGASAKRRLADLAPRQP